MNKGTPASSQIIWLEGEITRLREENARLQGLLREAHVKMEANNLWSNLRHRVAAAILGDVKAEAACPELDEAP